MNIRGRCLRWANASFFLVLYVVASFVSVAADELTSDLLEKAIHSVSDNVSQESIQLARDRDTSALYSLARDLEAEDHLTEALPIFHHLADAEQGHIASQISLGFIYYKKIVDHAKALHYFISSGEKGPNQASLYNAGRIFAEHSNWVPAVAYIQAAVLLGERSEQDKERQLTKTVTEAFETLSQTIASQGLSIQESADIFMYASLDGFPEQTSGTTKQWSDAMHALLKFQSSYVEGNGQSFHKDALTDSISLLRNIWETDAAKLSTLQAHLLLHHINDALAIMAGLDEAYSPAAAGYAEAHAMSQYCFHLAALSEEDPSCFNQAASNAAMYYRRANDTVALKRVGDLARNHPAGATSWKRTNQTPLVFHPELKAKPYWDPKDFPTSKSLLKIYSVHKENFRVELIGIKTKPEVWSFSGQLDRTDSDKVQVEADGTTTEATNMPKGVLHAISIPYTSVYSGSGTFSGWAEYELFDGRIWNKQHCKATPSVCQALRSPATSMCAGVRQGISREDVTRKCGTDLVATVVHLQAGTRILPQCGPTNRRLILHWCLEGCDGVEHSVGGKLLQSFGQKDGGKPLLFDDSFEYSIHHKGAKDAYFVQAIFAHPEADRL